MVLLGWACYGECGSTIPFNCQHLSIIATDGIARGHTVHYCSRCLPLSICNGFGCNRIMTRLDREITGTNFCAFNCWHLQSRL